MWFGRWQVPAALAGRCNVPRSRQTVTIYGFAEAWTMSDKEKSFFDLRGHLVLEVEA